MNLKKAKRIRKLADALATGKRRAVVYTKHDFITLTERGDYKGARHSGTGTAMRFSNSFNAIRGVVKLNPQGKAKAVPIRVKPSSWRGVYRGLKRTLREVDNSRVL